MPEWNGGPTEKGAGGATGKCHFWLGRTAGFAIFGTSFILINKVNRNQGCSFGVALFLLV
jgi:hypothetical protein